MRFPVWIRISVMSAGLCALVGLPALAQQQQQSSSQQQTGDSVADAARKAREKQKAEAKPKKVYTEDDIPSRLGGDAAVTGSGGKAAGDTKAAEGKPGAGADAAGKAKEKEDPEKVWRKRFQDQREKIATAEQELDVLQRELDKNQVQYYSDPTQALKEQNSRKEINEKTAKIDDKKRQIAALKQQLSDMEDDLRKAGGDASWAR